MKVDKDLTFIAHWKKASIITYDANGGYINLSLSLTELRRTGEKLSYKEASKNGFTLEGWLVNDESSLDGSVITDLTTYVVGGDATFTAQWEKKNPDDYCTVQYNPNGGYFHNGPYVNYDNSEYEYKKGTTIQLIGIGQPNRPYKDGANLVGWIIKDGDGTVYKPCEYIDGELVGGEYTVTGDVTFVAVWDDDWVNITYTTEDGDYGKDEKGQPIKQLVTKVEPGKPIEAYDAPRCEGKLFMGFKVEGTDEIIYNGDYLKTTGKDPKDYTTILGYVPTTDMTLDALWDDDVYTITFESNYGVDGDPYVVFETIYAKKGCNIPEYPWATTDEKKEFIGYKIKGDTSGKIYEKGYVTYEDGEFFQIVANSDMTFEAVFVDGYEVTVDCDGGISKPYDEEYKTSTLIFEKNKPFPKKAWYGDELDNLYKTNYVLKGWKIIDDPDEKIYEDIADIVITRDMTIKAVWDGDCSSLGHDLEEHEANDATCEEGGNSTYWSCKRCGKYFSDAEGETEIEEGSWIILPPGHSMEGFAANEASCVENGNSEYWYCGRCDKYFSDAEGKDEIEENSWIIPATGHDLEEHAANEVSCEEDGNSAYWYCKKCDKYFSDAEGTKEIEKDSWIIPKLGHDLTEHEAKEAACKQAGNSAYWSCKNCDKYFSDAEGKTKIEKDSWVIPALSHNMTLHEANDATCEEAGNSAYWYCDKCEKYYSDAEGTKEIEENSWIISAKGHFYGKEIAEVPVTCTEDGTKAHYKCSNCGKLFVKDGSDYVLTTEEALKIKSEGHKEETVGAKEPSCTEPGHKAGKKCSVCGKTLEGLEEIPALDHTPVTDPAVEATTEKTGLTEGSHCSVCGTVLKKQETVPKKEDPKKAEEEAKKKAEEEAKKKAEEEAKKNQKTEYSNEWVDGKWYDANGINNYTATLQWKSDATGWWVQDTDNWYPADSWQKIDGVWYYFKPDGYMATNEYYNGYWFNADGSWDPQYNLSWMSNATGWWVEDISGWWPADAWLKIDGCWYYFDGSGYMVSNCYIDGYWIGADGVCR